MPKGGELNRATCNKICKTLHLAFKGKTTDEIYDILMEQLIRAIRQYDPHYSDKTRQVVETINDKLSQFQQITVLDVNRHLEFDATGHLRMLVRRGHLEKVAGPGRSKSYARSAAHWPPDAAIYSHPVGITYCIQKWFRCYLQGWSPRPCPTPPVSFRALVRFRPARSGHPGPAIPEPQRSVRGPTATWRSNRSKSLPMAMARASSFSSACCAWSKVTVMRPDSNRMPSGRFSNSC
jgi:hypothetical protein